MVDYITRKQYDEWIAHSRAAAQLCGYPVDDSMVDDNTGLIFADYDGFDKGLWSGEAHERFVIFQSVNEPAVEGMPKKAFVGAEYGGLCDKCMVLYPGQFCSVHYHVRKTEYYIVMGGTMVVLYSRDRAPGGEYEDGTNADLIDTHRLPAGTPLPADTPLPKGREKSYDVVRDNTVVLKPGDPRFVLPRKTPHAFFCPPDANVPTVIHEISCYSHEPTASGKNALLSDWQHIHDNVFLHPGIAEARLENNIKEE
ncbi:MAG: hypothetical protein JXR73_09830 [Candidatus Omnitrophica bacterium]|nr:hypothetical protein [Candidatus Omnitrophota bacterium]